MKLLSLIQLLLISSLSFSQVAKRVVVEHFTNTRCSICAQNNPGFYANLKNHPEVLHITIHPSAPYSNCYLHGLNPIENDARTNYYNAYGGTPRFFIQGKRDANANPSNPSFFSPHTGQSTSAKITMVQNKQAGNVIDIQVSVKKVATESLGPLRLFVALAQDSLLYAAPNGENLHQDVFIKALSEINGDTLSMPSNIGDSTIFNFSTTVAANWSFKRVYAIAILQEEMSKDVVQAEATFSDSDSPLGIESNDKVEMSLHPNPSNGYLQISLPDFQPGSVSVHDLRGNLVYETLINYPSDLSFTLPESVSNGTYILRFSNESFHTEKRIILE